jgi:hypothetical protein
VVGVAAAFILLIFLGFNIKALAAIGALAVFIAVIVFLVRGPTPLLEIVTDDAVNTRVENPLQIREEQAFNIPVSIPDVDLEPSDRLRKTLGPLATELHDLERQLLEEAANGRFAATDVARLAQELAKNRTELIGEEIAAANGSAAGQPDPEPTER